MRSGVVLAGGHATRFGGPKPLAPFRGRPLLAWAIDALRPHCGELLVMAGSQAAAISRVAEGARVLADPGGGPHVALALAARIARGHLLLVAPADAPLLTPATYADLLDAGPNAVAIDGAGVNPLVAVYERRAILSVGRVRSLQDAAERLGAARAAVSQASLADVDSPEDLFRLQRHAGQNV